MDTVSKKVVYSYKGYEIGTDDDGNIFVSKDIEDKRYSHIEVSSYQDAYDYIDSVTANFDD